MACYKAAAIFGLLLCVSVCTGQLQLSGHETPVYVGLSKVVTCTWAGSENITELDWYLVGLEGLRLGLKLGDDTTVLFTGRIPNISYDGKKFMCKVTLANGFIVKKTFALWVKEIKNEINITPSYVPCGNNHTLTAGDSHTLTCTVNSEFPAKLKWIRIIDEIEVVLENTPNLKVPDQSVSDEITKRSITFKPLLTLHAGKYKCVSVLTNMSPLLTKEMEYVVKVKFPPPTVELMSGNETVTSKNVFMTALINVHPGVDVPIDIDSSWYGHNSLEDAPRVTKVNSNNSSIVQFAPFISSDEGTYFFSTRLRALDSELFCSSSRVIRSIYISPSSSQRDNGMLQAAWNQYSGSCKCKKTQDNNCAHYLSDALIKGGFSELNGGEGLNHRVRNGFIVCPSGRPVQAMQLRNWAEQEFGRPHSSPKNGINFVYQEDPQSNQRHVVLKKYLRVLSLFVKIEHKGTGDYPSWEVQEYFYC